MIFDRSTYMGVHTGPHLSIPLPPWLNLHKPCAGGDHLIANVTFPAPHFCSNPLRCLFHPCLKTFKLLSLQPGKQHSYILLQMCHLLEDFIITFFFPQCAYNCCQHDPPDELARFWRSNWIQLMPYIAKRLTTGRKSEKVASSTIFFWIYCCRPVLNWERTWQSSSIVSRCIDKFLSFSMYSLVVIVILSQLVRRECLHILKEFFPFNFCFISSHKLIGDAPIL